MVTKKSKSIKTSGANDPKGEFIEALSMASYMGGGPSITYSAKALDAFEQMSNAKG